MKRSSMKQRVIAAAVSACFASSGHANPTSGVVASGGATFSSQGNTLTVVNTPGAIINWQQFSIQRDEITRFIQQNASSAVLNRVVGANPSVILGQLQSNGRVFLINPSGIAFGQGAVVNVAGLVASTLNISDGDFLSGRLRFAGSGGEGAVTNAGEIRTPTGGHVYLVAPRVANEASGVISSPGGEVIVGAGRTVELVNAQTPDIRVELTAPDNEAVNAGQIVAASGRIGIYGTLIRNSGLLSASRAEVGPGGKIVLKAAQIAVTDGGRIEASGDAGGVVQVEGSGVYLGSDSTIEADGATGEGGQVVVKGDDALRAYGTISARGGARGGFVETSGGYLELGDAPLVGSGGTWLIDPYDITIVAGNGVVNNTGTPVFTPTGDSSQIGANLISTQLNGGTSVVVDTGGLGSPGAQPGDITVNAQIGKSTGTPPAQLTLNAARDLNVNAPILIGSGGDLAINAGGNMTVNSVSVSSVSQNVTVGGQLQVRANAPLSTASLGASGAQTIHAGSIDLSVAANANNAQIFNSNPGAVQTIVAGAIAMSNAPSGGNNSAATITAGHQQITTSGDVTLTSGGAAGTLPGVRIGGGTNMDTDLTLGVGGTLTLNAGGANNGAALGSSAAGAPRANNITISTAGDVVLNAGSAPGAGVRIGSSSLNGTAGGNISISAAGSIRFNSAGQGAGIRTLGNVSLSAGNEITQALTGVIQAAQLSANASGNLSFAGANQVGVFNAGTPFGSVRFVNSGPLQVTSIAAGGTVDLSTTGALILAAGGTQDAIVTSAGGQTVTAESVSVTAQDGRFASLSNNGGDQTIAVSGGSGIDVVSHGGGASIANNGGQQSLLATDSDHINVNGVAGSAGIFGFGGTQTLSITGTGANAITLGAAGSFGPSNVAGSSQAVVAGATGQAGSITIVGTAGPNALAGFISNPGPGASQSVSTSGAISITGGSANPQASNFGTGIFHNGTGAQTISAGSIALQGGASGANNGAFISSQSTGAQSLSVAGTISVTGGAGGTNNIGSIFSRSSQTVQAGAIAVTSGAGGTNNSAALSAPTQVISTTGDVVLTGGNSVGTLSGVRIGGGGGAAPSSTNLTLNVGNDLVITGGNVENNGAGLGSTVSVAALANNITVTAGRDVILNEGAAAGARIGYSALSAPAGGNISVAAGGSIRLNGTTQPTSIRTLGDVSLDAGGEISANAAGSVRASVLTTRSNGATTLLGPNEVAVLNATALAGHIAFNNFGALRLGSVSAGGSLQVGTTGALVIAASGAEDAIVTSSGGQTLTAQSLSVTSQDGRVASLANFGGDQLISVSGGAGIDVVASSGSAQISNTGGVQRLAATDSDHVNVNGAGGFASVVAAGSLQEISITGSGANAITVGSTGATGASNVVAGSQVVLAGTVGEAGSIAVAGSGATSALAGFVTNPGPGGTQSLSTSGTLSITGGSAASQAPGFNAGVFHNGTGDQTVSARDIVIRGGTAGANNGTFIASQAFGASQVVNVTGTLVLEGSDAGANNRALLTSAGSQSVQGGADLSISAGASGVSGTVNAGLTAGAGHLQTIAARNITMTNAAAGGIDSFASIGGTNQIINATGNVTLTGRGSGGALPGVRIGGFGGAVPTATNVVLNVGGDLVLTGGAGANGAAIGGSAVATQPNTISISAGGSVILNSGSGAGARIGSSAGAMGGGDITILAGDRIELNGSAQPTAIRTLGNVALNAGTTISGASNGFVVASGLSTFSGGDTTLTGPNRVATYTGFSGGNLSFTNTAALGVTSLNATGMLSLDVAGALSLDATSTTPAIVTSGAGQDIRAQSLRVRAQDGGTALLNNQGSGTQTITITGGSIEVEALGAGSIAQVNQFGPDGQILAVSGGDLLIRGEGGGAGVFGLAGAQTVSVTGAISVSGNGAAPTTFAALAGSTQQLSASSLSVTSQNGATADVGGSLSQSVLLTGGNLEVANGGAGGLASLRSSGNQDISVVGGGDIQVDGAGGAASISASGASQSISTSGAITVSSVSSAVPVSGFNSGIFYNGTGAQTVSAGDITIRGGTTGASNGAFIASQFVGGSQTVNVTGSLTLEGSDTGINNRALLTSAGAQTIQGGADIAIRAGASGVSGTVNAGITAGTGHLQSIAARHIAMTNSAGGGTDSFASIGGTHQVINATGNVTLTGRNSGGSLPGVRIGGFGGALPTATNIVMNVGGDLVLTGGAGANGAAIGGSGVATQPNNISIAAGGSVTLQSGSGAGARIGSAAGAMGGGTISVTAGGNIALNGSGPSTAIRTLGNVTLQAGGTISEGPASLIVANALATQSGGSTTLGGPNQVAAFSGTSGGDLTLVNNGVLALNGTVVAGGRTSFAATSVNGAGSITSGNGLSVDVSADSLLSGTIAGAGGLEKLGTGTLTVSGENTYAGDTNVQSGTLALGRPDTTTTGAYNIAAGATLRGSPGSYTNAGAINGSGTLDVTGTSFTNAGTLRPGGSGALGTLTIAGNAVLAPSSLVEIEAQGAGAGNHDLLAILGAATLGGDLSVLPVNGYAPAAGDAITPVTYASRSGSLNPGAAWFPIYNASSLRLEFDPAINRWIGTSGNWAVASNWSLGHVPLASESVVIDVSGPQLVSVSGGARFARRIGAMDDLRISGGSLTLGAASTFHGALDIAGGTLQGTGNVTASGAFRWTDGALSGSGLFLTTEGATSTLAPGSQALVLDRTWENQGTIAFDAGRLKGEGVLRNEGLLVKSGAGKARIRTVFENAASGTVRVEDGELKLKQTAVNAGAVDIAGGAKLKVRGGDYVNTGHVSGSGTLDVDGGRFVNLGILAPGANGGAGIGTFTVKGDFEQGVSGRLQSGLGGTAAGSYDVLDVTGRAHLNGTLETAAVNGYVPAAGHQFKLITYKSRTGAFSTVIAPSGFTLDADYLKRFGLFTVE
jgi:filamentous hemagglutinin family protein